MSGERHNIPRLECIKHCLQKKIQPKQAEIKRNHNQWYFSTDCRLSIRNNTCSSIFVWFPLSTPLNHPCRTLTAQCLHRPVEKLPRNGATCNSCEDWWRLQDSRMRFESIFKAGHSNQKHGICTSLTFKIYSNLSPPKIWAISPPWEPNCLHTFFLAHWLASKQNRRWALQICKLQLRQIDDLADQWIWGFKTSGNSDWFS